jgi:hypothetical protein
MEDKKMSRVAYNWQEIVERALNECLIYDIESSSWHPTEKRWLDIRDDFDLYVQYAKVKWIGFYSYKNKEKILLPLTEETREFIKGYIDDHKYIIGANNEEFDDPVIINNKLLEISENYWERKKSLDIQKIIGDNPHGENFKNRGMWMGKKCKKYSLHYLAQAFNLDVIKGDIDYKIFYKDAWTEEEIADIKKYLDKDIEITKQMFDILTEFWVEFCEELSEKNIKNMSWVKASLASLMYKNLCDLFDMPETYAGNELSFVKEELGGRAIIPKRAEVHNAVYIDVVSLYPHMFIQFGLSGEITNPLLGVQNFGMFNTRGYYPADDQHFIDKYLAQVIKKRLYLKEHDPKNKKIYTLKIKANCFSEDTFVMTPKGVKNIKDFKVGDICWSLNKETFEVEEATVTQVHNYKHSGEFVKIHNKNTDLLVTEDHNMLAWEKDKLYFIKAKDFIKKRQILLHHKNNDITKEMCYDSVCSIDNVITHDTDVVKTDFTTSHCITLDKNNTIYAGRNDTFTWVGQSYYGMARSPVFESVYKPNAGYDCCYLGQQVHKFVQKYLEERGYEIVGGFTDSWFVKRLDGVLDVAEVQKYCAEAVAIMQKSMPYPVDTFSIEVETVMKYLLYNWDYKKEHFAKNNYYYVYEKNGELKSKFVGLAIMKDGSTDFSMYLFKKYLEPAIFKRLQEGKQPERFDKNYLIELIRKELPLNKEKMVMLYNFKATEKYEDQNNIRAQLSRAYAGGRAGYAEIIKNRRLGDAGKGAKYCLKEDIDKLEVHDFILDKVYRELQPFCKTLLNGKEETKSWEDKLLEEEDWSDDLDDEEE